MSFLDIQDEAFFMLALHGSPPTKKGSSAHDDAETLPSVENSDSNFPRSARLIEEPALRHGKGAISFERIPWYVALGLSALVYPHLAAYTSI